MEKVAVLQARKVFMAFMLSFATFCLFAQVVRTFLG